MSDATKPFQLFDALDPATEAALRASISRWGVIVPVIVDMDGNILDGHHRSRIATELGMKYPTNRIQVNSHEMGEEIARTLNTDRRHLTVEQRQQLVVDLRAQGFSTRAIAGAVGVGSTTVHRDLASVPDGTVELATVTGLNGKTYAPTQPARANVPRFEHEEPVTLADADDAPVAQPVTKPVALFTLEEQALLDRLNAGETVVLNMRQDAHSRLWAHAESIGKAVRIDRKSEWGNPFLLDADGNRDEVCDWYRAIYWPHKASLHRNIHQLHGKALGCWCAPLRCHGDFLQAEAES